MEEPHEILEAIQMIKDYSKENDIFVVGTLLIISKDTEDLWVQQIDTKEQIDSDVIDS